MLDGLWRTGGQSSSSVDWPHWRDVIGLTMSTIARYLGRSLRAVFRNADVSEVRPLGGHHAGNMVTMAKASGYCGDGQCSYVSWF